MKKAFVIMPFGEKDTDNEKMLTAIYQNIYKVVLEDSGYITERVDEIYKPSVIIDTIAQSIKDADIILCDLSENNPNVLYELGLAHAIKKSVILTCNIKNLKEGKLPFDVNGVQTILYNRDEVMWVENLKEKIRKSIESVKEGGCFGIPYRVNLIEPETSNFQEIRDGLCFFSDIMQKTNFTPEVVLSFCRSGNIIASMYCVNENINGNLIGIRNVLTIPRDGDSNPFYGEFNKYIAKKIESKKVAIFFEVIDTGANFNFAIEFLSRMYNYRNTIRGKEFSLFLKEKTIRMFSVYINEILKNRINDYIESGVLTIANPDMANVIWKHHHQPWIIEKYNTI